MAGNDAFIGGVPMMKIDGAKIRQLREEKGVTQLYLATAVGVTTDTISRWENKKYPAIKKENALKLAEALEIEIEAILESTDIQPEEESMDSSGAVEDFPAPKQQMDEQRTPQRRISKKKWLFAVMTLAVICLLLWVYHMPKTGTLVARRVLPDHTVPGGTFPVVVHIAKEPGNEDSFILKEKIPESGEVVDLQKDVLLGTPKNQELKWIVKAKQAQTDISYLFKPSLELKDGDRLHFFGEITHKLLRGKAQKVAGPEGVVIGTFHWADQNKDGRIDDEEMLNVYDEFGDLTAMPVNLDLIEEIWFGSGYTWSVEKRQFIIQP